MRRRTLLKAAAASLVAAPAIAQPAKAATLRFVPQANLTLLDPIFTPATVTNNHAYYVFDALYSVGPDGVARPQMAEGHQISADGRTWTIKLREGLLFHDGTPVRTTDCIASVQRWAVFDSFGQLLTGALDGFHAADDRTIEVRLKRPFPLLAEALGKADSRVPFIMPERLARTPPDKAITEMVGSGPYRFVADEFVTGSLAVYEKFTGYQPRQEPAVWGTGGKVCYYPRIEWHVIPDAATASAALQNNEIDWWEQPITDLLPQLAADRNIVLQTDQPWGRISEMQLNQLHPPFDNVKVRRAAMMATNQDDVMRATFGDDQSLWRECKDVYPYGSPYYTGADADLMKGDIAVATQLLKESGYNGEKVVVLNPTDFPVIHPLGVVAADTLKKIGMNVDLQETDWGTVVQRRGSREPVEKGGWSVFHTFSSSTALATPATHPLLSGRGKDGWFGWWDNAEARRLTDEWLNAPDRDAQARAAKAIGHVAMTDVATIIVGQWYGKTAFRRSITGVLQGLAPYPWNVRPA